MTRRTFATAAGLAFGVLLQAGLAQAAAPAAADASFIAAAGHAGAAEVEASQAAETAADRADVRALAATMVRDHTWINGKLALVARTMGVAAPSAPDAAQQRMLASLQGLHGASFDRAYLDQQATAHQAAVALYSAEAEHGADANLKALAALVLPRLRTHLAMIEKLGGRPAAS